MTSKFSFCSWKSSYFFLLFGKKFLLFWSLLPLDTLKVKLPFSVHFNKTAYQRESHTEMLTGWLTTGPKTTPHSGLRTQQSEEIPSLPLGTVLFPSPRAPVVEVWALTAGFIKWIVHSGPAWNPVVWQLVPIYARFTLDAQVDHTRKWSVHTAASNVKGFAREFVWLHPVWIGPKTAVCIQNEQSVWIFTLARFCRQTCTLLQSVSFLGRHDEEMEGLFQLFVLHMFAHCDWMRLLKHKVPWN